MGIDPDTVPTVTLGAAAGLGENNLTRIDIIGEELKRLKFKVKLPQEQLNRSFPQLEISGKDKTCSGCFIPLLSELLTLSERGATLKMPLRICLGEIPDIPEDRAFLLIGNCAISEMDEEANCVAGCPPVREDIHQRLEKYFS